MLSQEQCRFDALGESELLPVVAPGPLALVRADASNHDDVGDQNAEVPVNDPGANQDKYRLFGDHTPEQYAVIKTSAAQSGILVATVRDQQGNLLDGFLRSKVAADLRIPCLTEIRTFSSEAEKYEFILKVNCQRRQLNKDQKRKLISAYLVRDPEINDNWLAEIIGGISKNTVSDERHRLEAEGQIQKLAKLRGKDGKSRPVKSKRIIANTPKECEKAQEIIKNLPDSCAGKTIDVTTAGRRAKRHKTTEERENRIILPLPTDAIQIHHCRFQELEHRAGIKPGAVKLISTDIPYGADFLSQLDDLGAFAQRVLTDGGLFVCLCGGYYLNQYIRVFDKYLTYRWLLSSQWNGDANLIHPLQITSQQKPILLYSKGDWIKRPMWPDLIRVNCKEKEWDDWQQPMEQSERLIKYFSEPGDLVVDPCGGGFTNAEACFRLARRCITCDVKAECVSKGQERLDRAVKEIGNKDVCG
jgi:hypothetical protein